MPPRTPKQAHLGPMSANSAHIPHYVPPKVDFADVPQRVTNSSSRAPLELSKEWSSVKRPGSMDAFSLPSRGF
jgi:hypothetical protein